MKMTFRTGIQVKIPTSKQLSGMGATRRMPTWYAADYFPELNGDRAMQDQPCQGKDDALPLDESSTGEDSDEEEDTSTVSDAREDSTSDACSVESEMADPSWVPPPIGPTPSKCPLQAPERKCSEGRPKRLSTRRRKGGALLRALSLRSRTITMGPQKPGGRARLIQQRCG